MGFTHDDVIKLSKESGYSESACLEALQQNPDPRNVCDIMSFLRLYFKPENKK